MNCKIIRDHILAGYLDDELSNELTAWVKAHIDQCDDCRLFYDEVKIHTLKPFEEAEEFSPSDDLWNAVKERIQDDSPPAVAEGLFDRLKRLIFVPKPVFALGSIAVVILMAVTLQRVPLKTQGGADFAANGLLDDVYEYFVYLENGDSGFNGSSEFAVSMGTEEFFL